MKKTNGNVVPGKEPSKQMILAIIIAIFGIILFIALALTLPWN